MRWTSASRACNAVADSMVLCFAKGCIVTDRVFRRVVITVFPWTVEQETAHDHYLHCPPTFALTSAYYACNYTKNKYLKPFIYNYFTRKQLFTKQIYSPQCATPHSMLISTGYRHGVLQANILVCPPIAIEKALVFPNLVVTYGTLRYPIVGLFISLFLT